MKSERVGCKVFGRTLVVGGGCTSCGICASGCPTGNIVMVLDRPKFAWVCCLCMRCVYACPEAVIKPRIMKFFVLKEGFNLDKIISEQVLNEENDLEGMGIVWSGVVKYIKETNYF